MSFLPSFVDLEPKQRDGARALRARDTLLQPGGSRGPAAGSEAQGLPPGRGRRRRRGGLAPSPPAGNTRRKAGHRPAGAALPERPPASLGPFRGGIPWARRAPAAERGTPTAPPPRAARGRDLPGPGACPRSVRRQPQPSPPPAHSREPFHTESHGSVSPICASRGTPTPAFSSVPAEPPCHYVPPSLSQAAPRAAEAARTLAMPA